MCIHIYIGSGFPAPAGRRASEASFWDNSACRSSSQRIHIYIYIYIYIYIPVASLPGACPPPASLTVSPGCLVEPWRM